MVNSMVCLSACDWPHFAQLMTPLARNKSTICSYGLTWCSVMADMTIYTLGWSDWLRFGSQKVFFYTISTKVATLLIYIRVLWEKSSQSDCLKPLLDLQYFGMYLNKLAKKWHSHSVILSMNCSRKCHEMKSLIPSVTRTVYSFIYFNTTKREKIAF